MHDSFKLKAIVASIFLAFTSVPMAQENDTSQNDWIVTCSEKSTLVFRQKMSEEDANRRHFEITNRYPKATCVFIATKPAISYTQEWADMPIGSIHIDDDLNAALMAIQGSAPNQIDIRTTPQPPYSTQEKEEEPIAVQETLYEVITPPDILPNKQGWVRLSVYKTDDISDALNDWENLTKNNVSLTTLTPSAVSTEDGYIVINVGPIQRSDLEDFCLLLQNNMMDCDGADFRQEEDHAIGLKYLKRYFNDIFQEDSASEKRLVLKEERGNTCWKSPFLKPRDFPPSPAYMEHMYQKIIAIDKASDFPPLPKPRPHL